LINLQQLTNTELSSDVMSQLTSLTHIDLTGCGVSMACLQPISHQLRVIILTRTGDRSRQLAWSWYHNQHDDGRPKDHVSCDWPKLERLEADETVSVHSGIIEDIHRSASTTLQKLSLNAGSLERNRYNLTERNLHWTRAFLAATRPLITSSSSFLFSSSPSNDGASDSNSSNSNSMNQSTTRVIGWPALRYLDLGRVVIRDTEWEALPLTSPLLEEFHIAHTSISSVTLTNLLNHCPQLRMLSIADEHETMIKWHEALRELRYALPSLTVRLNNIQLTNRVVHNPSTLFPQLVIASDTSSSNFVGPATSPNSIDDLMVAAMLDPTIDDALDDLDAAENNDNAYDDDL
jgi:hypothetical protein